MQRFSKQVSLLLFFVFFIQVIGAGIALADKVYFKNGKKQVGIILGQDENALHLQLPLDTREIPLDEIEKVEEWNEVKNARLQRVWFWSTLPAKFMLALVGGPTDLNRFFKNVHRKIFRLFEKNPVFRSFMKKSVVKAWKKKFSTSFYLCVYCIHLFVLGLIVFCVHRGIRMVKEIIARRAFYMDADD